MKTERDGGCGELLCGGEVHKSYKEVIIDGDEMFLPVDRQKVIELIGRADVKQLSSIIEILGN